ncbi:MAG TPA: hypothetical protein VG013_41165 [Gemmataceae bacterium]|jgi:hypothetical protein|nr:hypothetical protein [Gemmataceae bacterium]
MTPDDVLESLAEECRVDHVGLWEIVDAVRFDLGSTSAPETRALTLRLVRSLLFERGMQVGHPAPDGRHFVSWDLPPDQALSRIEKEWSALGREPNIGEVAWFTSAQEAPNKPLQQTGPA